MCIKITVLQREWHNRPFVSSLIDRPPIFRYSVPLSISAILSNRLFSRVALVINIKKVNTCLYGTCNAYSWYPESLLALLCNAEVRSFL